MRAAVIGLGTMGPGIAATLARAGMDVSAYDAAPAQRERAPQGFAAAKSALDALAVPDRGTGAPIAVAETLAACVAGAELVIETVPEQIELKIQVFGEIEAAVGPGCIL